MFKKHLLLITILIFLSCNSKNDDNTEYPEFQIGVVADCQYCYCEPTAVRFYKESPDRLCEAVGILNKQPLDFTVHLGDFIDKDFSSFDTITPIWKSLKSNKYHVLGNHDEPRLASRYGEGRARAAAVLVLTLRGTPTIYYGDELGMTDGLIPAGREQDPWGRRYPHLNRDKCRTPMQWTSGDGMSFTTAGTAPWLPFSDAEANVASQIDNPDSMLTLYRTLLELRHREPALTIGSFKILETSSEHVLDTNVSTTESR